jgi:hypothetical protein
VREARLNLLVSFFICVSLNTSRLLAQDDNIIIKDNRYDLSLEKKVVRDLERVRKSNNASPSDIKKFIEKHDVDLTESEINEIENSEAIAGNITEDASLSDVDELEGAIEDTVKSLGGMKMDPGARQKLLDGLKQGQIPAEVIAKQEAREKGEKPQQLVENQSFSSLLKQTIIILREKLLRKLLITV